MAIPPKGDPYTTSTPVIPPKIGHGQPVVGATLVVACSPTPTHIHPLTWPSLGHGDPPERRPLHNLDTCHSDRREESKVMQQRHKCDSPPQAPHSTPNALLSTFHAQRHKMSQNATHFLSLCVLRALHGDSPKSYSLRHVPECHKMSQYATLFLILPLRSPRPLR